MAKGKQARAQAPWTAKATIAVVVMGLLGGLAGATVALPFPDGGLFADDRARRALHRDTASSLKDVIALLEDDPVGVVALAHVLLWREHVAGDDHRVAAEKLLLRSPAARTSPEGLYARALLVEGGAADDALDPDLKAGSTSPWTQLARASRAREVDERLRLFEQAATTATPLPHATHRLARAAAVAGDLPLARAGLDRLFVLAPEHPGGLVTAVALALIEEARLPENRRRKAGEALPAEARLAAATDLDEDDARLRDLVTLTLAAGRGQEAPAPARARLLEGAPGSAGLTRAALELALADGDVGLARALVETCKSIERLDLVVAVSRARFLLALAEAEVRAAAKEPRRVAGDGVVLPLGTLRLVVDAPGLPFAAALSPTFYPEARYQRLLADIAGGSRRERLDERLKAIEHLGLAERALARADVDGAAVFLTTAQARAGLDPDVSLVEAAVRARKGDTRGAETAIDTAVASATQDPELLLSAARLALELEHLGGARRALSAFRKLGFKAAQASALEASVEARGGDLGAARAAIAEATRLGGGTDPLTLRASIFVYRQNDPARAQAAASLLLKSGAGDGGGDVVAAWVADAARRDGDVPRAEATLQAVTRNRPQLGEAWLFYARAIDDNPQRQQEALAAATTAARLAGPLQAEAKRYVLELKNKMTKRR